MSLTDDAKNRFDRQRPQTPTSLEQKNRFDRKDDQRNAERANTTVFDNRVKRNAEDNARWVDKLKSAEQRDPETARLKKAAYASRTAPKAAPVGINLGTLAACIAYWKQNWPNGKLIYELYEDNDFNRQQLNEATQHLLQRGHAVDVQLAEDAFQLCYAGNHLDPRKRTDRAGNIVHLRGEARRPAPVPFPRVIWADEAAAIQREHEEKAGAAAAAETSRAKSLPFDQLKKEATKDRKPASPLMGPMVS